MRIHKKNNEIENPLDFSSKISRVEKPDQGGRVSRQNRSFVWWTVCVLFILLYLQSFNLQIIQGVHYKEKSEGNRIRTKLIKAPRGIIKDTHGQTLVQNIPSFDAVFIPAYLPKDKLLLKQEIEKVAPILSMSPQEIEHLILEASPSSQNMHLINENISQEAALIIEEKLEELKGFDIAKTAKRQYVDGETFAHIIGYEGKINKQELADNQGYVLIDNIGKNGIEFTYEKFLHGTHGAQRFEVDSAGRTKKEIDITNPLAGDEVTLNIDADLQRKITEILKKTLEQNSDATGAVVVALDPRNGAVRALVSQPSFDNNLFAQGIETQDYQRFLNDPQKPLLNRAVSGEYPPGSTFKPMMAAAALEEGVINEGTTVGCSGGISHGAWKFPDWKAHGVTSIKKAIAESCDVFFYAIGGGWKHIPGLGIERLVSYSKRFGLSEVLGIDLPNESSGLVPGEPWKFRRFGEKWYIGDTYHSSIGQGYVLATPLQMASVTATIANGGTLYRPKVVSKIINAKTKEEQFAQPEVILKDIVSPSSIDIVKRGMRQTVEKGSGRSLANLKVTTAGKTGTAQFGNEDKLHSWYVAFGPYPDASLATVVLIEGGGEGHDWAVPVTREIYRWYFDLERGTLPDPGEENKPKVNADFTDDTGHDL